MNSREFAATLAGLDEVAKLRALIRRAHTSSDACPWCNGSRWGVGSEHITDDGTTHDTDCAAAVLLDLPRGHANNKVAP